MGSLAKFNSRNYSPLIYGETPDLKPGTIAYDDFWDEQDDRCRNGYKPEGMPRITGRHYFYLNMNKISLLPIGAERKRPGSPFYRALDRRLFLEEEDARKNKHGLIVGKPRRVGLSWFAASLIFYELIFYWRNNVGVCAGQQNKADDFYKKVIYLISNIREEYRVGVSTKNDEELTLGYKYTENKQSKEGGLLSSMFIKTMFSSSTGFEGKELSMCVFEEAGLFENIIESFKSTEPCFREGDFQYGTPIIYGTGGQIEKGSKGYKEMWENASEAFNLKKIFIPASEYYPGDGVPDKKTGEVVTFFDFNTGETNQELAREFILKGRERASKSKTGYIKHIQSYPLKESEIFIKTEGGILDRKVLNNQLIRLNEGDIPKRILIGKMIWVDNDKTRMLLLRARNTKERTKIRISQGSKVKFKEDPEGTLQICDTPINRIGADYQPDIAGIDSYDHQVAQTGKHSYGAMVVYRNYNGPTKEYDYPVAILKERGDSSSDDSFYEHSLMVSLWYNCLTLVEYTKMNIMTHWTDVGAQHMLKERPQLEAVIGRTVAVQKFGQQMTSREKNVATSLLKTEVKESIYQVYFKDLIIDLIDYGDVNTDLAMAYAMCLFFKLEMFPEISEGIDYDDDDLNEDPLMSQTYYDLSDGTLVIKNYLGNEPQSNNEIQYFNPKLHLSESDRRERYEIIKRQNSEKEKRKKEIEEKYGSDTLSFVVKDLIKR